MIECMEVDAGTRSRRNQKAGVLRVGVKAPQLRKRKPPLRVHNACELAEKCANGLLILLAHLTASRLRRSKIP